MKKSDADIIADGREYIERNGWWRGSLVGPNGRQVCGMGAVLVSQGWHRVADRTQLDPKHHADWCRIEQKLLKAFPKKMKRAFHGFTDWNDDPKGAEDKQAVLDVFAKAEKIERAGFDPDA